eukprot:UN24348
MTLKKENDATFHDTIRNETEHIKEKFKLLSEKDKELLWKLASNRTKQFDSKQTYQDNANKYGDVKSIEGILATNAKQILIQQI